MFSASENKSVQSLYLGIQKREYVYSEIEDAEVICDNVGLKQ
jgi:hypothetical protein